MVGDGAVAWTAALLLARTTPRTTVTVLRGPLQAPGLADRLPATVPASAAQLARLGLSDGDLIATGAAVHRVGERWQDWGADSADWAQGFGTAVSLALSGAPHQLWLQAGRHGRVRPLASVFPASALADANRYADPSSGARSPAEHLDPALRLIPPRFLPVLVEAARRAGARVRPERVQAAPRDEDSRASLLLDSGERLRPDLIVDTTSVVAHSPGARWIGWEHWIPADRLMAMEHPAQPSPADCYRAVDIGWRATWSWGDRALSAIGYAAGQAGEAQAARVLGVGDGSPEVLAFRPGRLEKPLLANVVAVGDPACVPGPLSLTGFALAQLHLQLLAELLPARRADPLLVAEYNRRANLRSDRVRDYVAAAHVILPRRRGKFWRALAGGALPDGLAWTLAQFEQRGLVPHHEEESFSRDDWAQRLIGLGVRPRCADPVAMAPPSPALRAALAEADRITATLVAEAPPYPAFLGSLRRR